MHITLTADQAAIHDRGAAADVEALLAALTAEAQRMSARNGYISVFFDYETVEILHPDGSVLAAVEADPWAPEQRELALRIFAEADENDVVPRAAAIELVRSEYGDAHPDWHKTQYGTALAECMGCWQAYANLCEQKPGGAADDS